MPAGFQTKVVDLNRAYAGDPVGQREYRGKAYISSTIVTVARFCWIDEVSSKNGEYICQVKGTNKLLAGFIPRNNENSQAFEDLHDGYSMRIGANQNVEAVKRGEFYTYAPAGAIGLGDKVYANNLDGTIAVGDGTAKPGYTLTNFVVTSINIDDLIAISNVDNVEGI